MDGDIKNKQNPTDNPEQSTSQKMESATTQQQTANESEQKTEEAQTKTEIPPEPEKEKVIKLSLKQKIQLKAGEINQKFSIKYPKAAKKTSTAVNYISEVWKETFPKN